MDEQLLGLAEIADLYSVDKSTASNWSRSRDFPEPRYRLKMGPIWTFGQLERWRIPARTVRDDFPPAPILEVVIDALGTLGAWVKCPFCPKKHLHGAETGLRSPHCVIPTFDASYIITDPNGLVAKARQKWSVK